MKGGKPQAVQSAWTQLWQGDTAFPRRIRKSNEWFTPAPYVDAARSLMGGIELDPASCALANNVVKAERYYDLQSDGLSQVWKARSLWLNPPYGRVGKNESSQEIWSCKLIAAYQTGATQEAVLLANAAVETRWFQRLWDFPICFVRGRICFYTSEGQTGGPTQGSALVYFGPQVDRFVTLFTPFGHIVLPFQASPSPHTKSTSSTFLEMP